MVRVYFVHNSCVADRRRPLRIRVNIGNNLAQIYGLHTFQSATGSGGAVVNIVERGFSLRRVMPGLFEEVSLKYT
jgi:hypothetical protein